jgi:redox-sensitive bicupin YhaK (pirin superfamily)
MITKRPAAERGATRTDWLDSRHTFSFNRYYDPRYTGFGDLLVINEDTVAPAGGFGTHGHRDMEIITYVVAGALEHRDSIGNSSVIRPGEVQRMSAGTGVRHSEFNHAPDEVVHFLQIWIEPDTPGIAPGYEQTFFADEEKRGRLRLIAAPDGRDGAVRVKQDARVYATLLAEGEEVRHELNAGRYAWVQVARGAIELNGQPLAQGDGAAVSDESALTIRARKESEVLLFDLA